VGVTREDVRHIAKLARLELEEAELERYTRELADILRHIDELAALEVEGAGAGTPGGQAPLRDDAAAPDGLMRSPAELAPEWRHGFFVVPRLAAHDREEGE